MGRPPQAVTPAAASSAPIATTRNPFPPISASLQTVKLEREGAGREVGDPPVAENGQVDAQRSGGRHGRRPVAAGAANGPERRDVHAPRPDVHARALIRPIRPLPDAALARV